MDTLMWEAKAAPGRADDLVAWAREQALPELRALAGAERVELFRAADERVVVIAVVRPEAPRQLAPAPAELVDRPPHAWCFQRLTLD